jgi:hypothetical protein
MYNNDNEFGYVNNFGVVYFKCFSIQYKNSFIVVL